MSLAMVSSLHLMGEKWANSGAESVRIAKISLCFVVELGLWMVASAKKWLPFQDFLGVAVPALWSRGGGEIVTLSQGTFLKNFCGDNDRMNVAKIASVRAQAHYHDWENEPWDKMATTAR